MIPYILAAVGGYLLGQSRKETYADGGIVSEKFKELTSDGYNFLGNYYEKYKLKVPEYQDWQVVAIEDNIKLIASKSQKVFFRRFFRNGGIMDDGGKAGFITIAEMMREYFKLKRLKDNDYAFMDSDFDDFESGDYESLLGDVKDGVLKITNKGNTLLLDQNDDYHITFNGKKLATNDLFKEGDKYFFAKNNEYLTFKKNGKGMMWLDKDGKVSIATKGMDASHFVFMFDNKKDWENYQPSMMADGGMMAKGGEVDENRVAIQKHRNKLVSLNSKSLTPSEHDALTKAINIMDMLLDGELILSPEIEKMYKMAKGGKVKKKWIQDALSGGKNKGALRRTAAKKGLLRGDENLSKTDLKKLQKMGGTTAKRAHLAETLRKFDEGGDV